MRVFDADEEAPGGWIDSVELFGTACVQNLIPIAVPCTIDDEQSLVAVAFAPAGRLGVTAFCPDPNVRIRLALGLIDIAKARVTDELGSEGVAPA